MQKKIGLYGYCIILTHEPIQFDVVTMETCRSKVRTVHYEDMAMVVSNAPYVVPPKRDNVFAHQNVILKVMESYTAIPFSFGRVFRSEGDVVVLLKKLSETVHELVPQFDDKIEMGLRIFGKKEWFDTEIEANSKLAEMKRNMERTSEDAAFYERIKAGEMARDLYVQLQEQVVEGINVPLSKMADSAKLLEPVGDRALLNAAYLIDKNREPLFDNMVNELYEKWKDKLEFKYSGPWPVYNFVNIRITVGDDT